MGKVRCKQGETTDETRTQMKGKKGVASFTESNKGEHKVHKSKAKRRKHTVYIYWSQSLQSKGSNKNPREGREDEI